MILDSFETKEKILIKFLKIAEIEGWNDHALLLTFQELQIDEKYLPLIFEDNILSLNQFHIDYFNQKYAEHIANNVDLTDKKLSEKIKILTFERFAIEKNNQLALQRLLNFYLNPKNISKYHLSSKPALIGLNNAFKISDLIWKLASDQSTDFNYYTKRLILSKILMRCFFVFIKDDENLIKTSNIIDSELKKVLSFTKFKYQILSSFDNLEEKIDYYIHNEKGQIKSPKEIFKSLPFIRLLKF